MKISQITLTADGTKSPVYMRRRLGQQTQVLRNDSDDNGNDQGQEQNTLNFRVT